MGIGRGLPRALAMLPLAAALHAQRPDEGARAPGRVRPTKAHEVGRVPAAQQAHARATLDRLLAIALRNPALTPPVGFDVEHLRIAYAPIRPASLHAPLAYRVSGLLFWMNPQSRLGGAIGPSPVAMSDYAIHANDLRESFWVPQEVWRKLEPASRSLYWEPVRTGELQGHPVYEHSRVVITASSRPVFRPLSRERLLRHELDDHRRSLERVHTRPGPLRTQAEGCVAELESRLAALTPAEREAPGWLSLTPPPGVRGPRCSLLVDEGAMHARRIVEENPDFYDAALPRTAIQLVVVRTLRPLRGQRDNRYLRHHAAIREGLDYAALAAIIGDGR